jgi:hypothetical protein
VFTGVDTNMCLQEMICVLRGEDICAYRRGYLRLQKLHSIRRSSDFKERGHAGHDRPSDLKLNPFIYFLLGDTVSGIPNCHWAVTSTVCTASGHQIWPQFCVLHWCIFPMKQPCRTCRNSSLFKGQYKSTSKYDGSSAVFIFAIFSNASNISFTMPVN